MKLTMMSGLVKMINQILKQFKEDLAKEMIEKQTYEVDAIATATETSEGVERSS